MNVFTVKNTYKTGYRIGLVFIHLQDGKSIYSTAFICNAVSISCIIAALGCRVLEKYRSLPGLSLVGDVISNGGTRQNILEMLL